VRHSVSRFAAGMIAIAFVTLLQRTFRREQRTRGRLAAFVASALAAITLASPSAHAADLLMEGTDLRAEFTLGGAGWHTGTLRRMEDRCWMVFLSKATEDGYTLIALSTAKRVQITRDGQWIDTTFAATLKDQPASCLEEGND